MSRITATALISAITLAGLAMPTDAVAQQLSGLRCSGDTSLCAGALPGLGLNVLWNAAVSHGTGAIDGSYVNVLSTTCSPTGSCTSNLQFGDNRWYADFPAVVTRASDPAGMVNVTSLRCSGNTGRCVAILQFGDGQWIATWSAAVSHR